ncbi:hypothetical protein BF95_23615 [Sphingobium sp. Ant17]|nr:hypothetical protein BF95_23615 [Sphingobium sp. Ant17]
MRRHHRFDPCGIASQAIGNIERARHHPLPPYPFEIMPTRLFGDHQRNDRRNRHADRQDDENLSGHGPEEDRYARK